MKCVGKPQGGIREDRDEEEGESSPPATLHVSSPFQQEPDGDQHGSHCLQCELEAALCREPAKEELTYRQQEEADSSEPERQAIGGGGVGHGWSSQCWAMEWLRIRLHTSLEPTN